MSFNDNSQLDTSQVQDRRGAGTGLGGMLRGGFGGGSRRSGGIIGGGFGAILVIILALVFGFDPAVLGNLGTGTQPQVQSDGNEYTSGDLDECKTGSDANNRADCRIVGTVNTLNSYWNQELTQLNYTYSRPAAVLFSRGVYTQCGYASDSIGPFYCPGDSTAYFDTNFFNDLSTQYGANNGPLATQYVVAHEFGHHIQSLTGSLNSVQQDRQGADSAAVRSELQADCYAGMWAKNASTQVDPSTHQPYMKNFTQQDLQDALSAAEAVGDDRIQSRSGQRVNPDSWTHGSSAQRMRWFNIGYTSGDFNKCNTFAAKHL